AFGPEHAYTIASGGLSKADAQKFLYERARNKVGLLKLRAMYKAENWPDWVDQNDDEALCPIVGKPEDIHLVVTGGPGKHSAFIPTFGPWKSGPGRMERKGGERPGSCCPGGSCRIWRCRRWPRTTRNPPAASRVFAARLLREAPRSTSRSSTTASPAGSRCTATLMPRWPPPSSVPWRSPSTASSSCPGRTSRTTSRTPAIPAATSTRSLAAGPPQRARQPAFASTFA